MPASLFPCYIVHFCLIIETTSFVPYPAYYAGLSLPLPSSPFRGIRGGLFLPLLGGLEGGFHEHLQQLLAAETLIGRAWMRCFEFRHTIIETQEKWASKIGRIDTFVT